MCDYLNLPHWLGCRIGGIDYTMNQASDDLARLRVNGLITGIPGKNRYRSAVETTEQIRQWRRIERAVADLGQQAAILGRRIGFTRSGRAPSNAERTMSENWAVKSPWLSLT